MKNSNKGFTIIEVLIAMAIFSIGILAVTKMQFSSIKGNRTSFQISEALSLGEGKMEELMYVPYTTVIDTNNDGITGLDANTVGSTDGSKITTDGRYTILWNIADNFPVNNTKTIKIIILWNGGKKNLSISCIKAG